MADNKYTVNPASVQDIAQYERYAAEDVNLIESFEINSAFNTQKHVAELHIYTTGNTLLRSITNYLNYKVELGSGGSTEGSTSISLDPQQDAIVYGYENGGVKLLYIFLNNLFSDLKLGSKLYIKEISNDRTELKLSSTGIQNEDLKKYALAVKDRINDTSYFSEFRLNFGNNDLFIGINIDYNDDENVVTVKLYEPLPINFTVKSTLDIVEFVSNPLAYEVEAEFTPDSPRVPRLREANFNIDLEDNTAVPSQYFSYDELFSFSVDNSNYQVLSLFNERGAEISIDHTDYSDFIHFSSAEERLINFKYKLDLIKNYETSISNVTSTQGSSGITNNTTYYENLIKGVVDNFDHYERYLYFESGSYSWPKSNQNKPYVNQGSSTSEAITWFANQRTTANNYDVSNFNALTNTIPAFIREDDNNAQYVLFVQMLAQHFDNLYVYAKAVSDKYDADNRINIGVSRDLVEDAIKSLGVKLYNSSKSLEDLFKYFVGEFQLDTGEVVNTNIQAGQLVSGGTTVEGPNEGFEVRFTDAHQSVYYPAFFSLFQPLLLSFFSSNIGYSYGFDNNYFSYNHGGEVYITITDGSNNSYGPFRYIIDEIGTGNNPIFNNQPGTINPSPTALYINPTDADGNDHSSDFEPLHNQTGIDVLIEDKKITESNPVTKPYQPTSEDIYQKSIYKRIYHNLPFLLKTKGTQRGLRALINCFGIPGSILKIKTYGGRDTSERPFFGDGQTHTISGQKVRTDNTGSIVEGDTLSRYTSIVKTDDSYNQDLHNVEVGFSPSDNLDSLIKSTLGADFTIDDYIGDPRDLTLDSYTDLLGIVKTALADVTERYDVKDFVRLIKFFDNVIFKMIKDFVPARSTTDTGIIIKPHLLDKSKAKSVIASATQPEYSGSIDTAFITGSHGDSFSISTGESSTSRGNKKGNDVRNLRSVQTPFGRALRGDRLNEQAKFDGNFNRSVLRVTNGELNTDNPFKLIKYPDIKYNVFFYKEAPTNICLYRNINGDIIQVPGFQIVKNTETPGDSQITISLADVFSGVVAGNTEFYKEADYTISADGESVELNGDEIQTTDAAYSFTETELPQYGSVKVLAYSSEGSLQVEDGDCFQERNIKRVDCTIQDVSGNVNVLNTNNINLLQYFNYNPNVNSTDNLEFSKDENFSNLIESQGTVFENNEEGESVQVYIRDSEDPTGCKSSRVFLMSSCPLNSIAVNTPTPVTGRFYPRDYFENYDENTSFYIKVFYNPGNGNQVVFQNGVNTDLTVSEDYGVLLTESYLDEGFLNAGLEIWNDLRNANPSLTPTSGITSIQFWAVDEAGVCESSTDLIDVETSIEITRRRLGLRYTSETYPEQFMCYCMPTGANEGGALIPADQSVVEVWYETEKTIAHPSGRVYTFSEVVNLGKRLYLNNLITSTAEVLDGTYGYSPHDYFEAFDALYDSTTPDEVDIFTNYATYTNYVSSDRWTDLQSVNCTDVCNDYETEPGAPSGINYVALGDD